MDHLDDNELLAEFARTGSEAAFGALVARHVNLVYSAAWRFTRNPDHAAEISQAVFIILARKAGSLKRGTVLSGWLYQAVRLTAANFAKREIRRQRREQEAYMQSTLNEPDDAAWEEIGPVLDQAMGRLGETDRNAIVLRYFENKTAAEIGAALNLTEAAANMRVRRALEKLRQSFKRHGVSSSTAALAGAISIHSIQIAPAALAHALALGAVSQSAAVGASTLTLSKGTLKLMAWTKAKTTVMAGIIVFLTAGTAVVGVGAVNIIRTRAALRTMQGNWAGIFTGGGIRLHLAMKIFKTNDAYDVTLDSPDQGAKDLPMKVISAHGDSVHLKLPFIDADYEATLNPDKSEMTGSWKQFNGTFPIAFKKATGETAPPAPMEAADYAPRAGSDLQGAWEGTAKVGPVKLRLDLRIAESAAGDFRAELDSVDQGARNLPVTSVTYHKPKVEFELEQIAAVFSGEVNARGEIKGTWSQMGQDIPLTFHQSLPKDGGAAGEKNFGAGAASQVEGHWKGALNFRGMNLPILFHIALMPDGSYTASMDSPDQGLNDIPASAVKYNAPQIHMEWQGFDGIFEGKLADGRLNGTWRQAGVALPLQLRRGEK